MSYLDSQSRIHYHRVTATDFPTISVFNGNSYSAANWVPFVAASSWTRPATATAINGVTQNWSANAAGNWQLQLDVVNAGESWVLYIAFVEAAGFQVQRFGI